MQQYPQPTTHLCIPVSLSAQVEAEAEAEAEVVAESDVAAIDAAVHAHAALLNSIPGTTVRNDVGVEGRLNSGLEEFDNRRLLVLCEASVAV